MNNQIKKDRIQLSVRNIINPKLRKVRTKQKKSDNDNMPTIISKPIRFEQMLDKVFHKNNKARNTIIYQSTKTTPIHTNNPSRQNSSKKTQLIQPQCLQQLTQKLTNFNNAQNISNAHNLQYKYYDSYSNKYEGNSQKNSVNNNREILDNYLGYKNQHQFSSMITNLYVPEEVIRKYEGIVARMQHQCHSHIRENQCFLEAKEVRKVLAEIGYDVHSDKFYDILDQLECEIYGGIPANNLRHYLSIIEGIFLEDNYCYDFRRQEQILGKRLPSNIIDKNLLISLTTSQKYQIYEHFRSWKLSQLITSKRCFPSISDKSIQKIFPPYYPLNNINTKLENQPKFIKYSSKIEQLLKGNNIEENKQNKNQFVQKNAQKIIQYKQDDEMKEILMNISNLHTNQINQTPRIISIQSTRKPKESDQISAQKSDKEQQNDNNVECFNNSISEFEDKHNQIMKLKQKLDNALSRQTLFHETSQNLNDKNKQQQPKSEQKNSKKPILSVNVNLGNDIEENLVVYEGQTSKQVCERLATKFVLTAQTQKKFKKMLDHHLKNMLWKIEQLSEELLMTENQ